MNCASSGAPLWSDIGFLLRSEQTSVLPLAAQPLRGAYPGSVKAAASGHLLPPVSRLLSLVFIAQLARYNQAMLLAHLLARFIGIGRLSVIDPAGKRHVFEGSPGPSATIRLHDRSLQWKLLMKPRLFVGEAYMDGTL